MQMNGFFMFFSIIIVIQFSKKRKSCTFALEITYTINFIFSNEKNSINLYNFSYFILQ